MPEPVSDQVEIPADPQGDPAPIEPKPKPEDSLGDGGKKALNTERDARAAAEKVANDLQKQLDAANQQLTAAKNDGLPEWQQKFNDLQTQLDGEVTARKQAEDDAAKTKLEQLRTDRASETEGFPRSLAKKLTGTTAEEIDAEITEIMADLKPRKPGQVLAEGRTVPPGTGDPATQFANIMTSLRRG